METCRGSGASKPIEADIQPLQDKRRRLTGMTLVRHPSRSIQRAIEEGRD